MKKDELEKYMGELSPEMQEKARQCKDMKELNALLAENDVELSEDALEAVSGGCSQSSNHYDQGDLTTAKCPACGCQKKGKPRGYLSGHTAGVHQAFAGPEEQGDQDRTDHEYFFG